MDKLISQYLKSGSQTEIMPEIQKIADSFTNQGIDLIFEIFKWLRKNLRVEDSKEIKNKVFRKRTAEEIIKDGFTTGCTDWALTFIVLARAKKIPTIYVEAIRRRWLDIRDENNIEGHIFAEVYLDNRWYIVDPTQICIKAWYNEYVIFKKGLDSWDIGIHNFDELKEQFLEFRKERKTKQG